MSKSASRWLACFCTAMMLSGFSSWSIAQQPTSPSQQDPSARPTPKDPRTRAVAHTELGVLYFRSGDLIIALEELTMAAAIDPDYATAFSTRGLILYHVKEFESAEKDFQRALTLEATNPEIHNNYGWFLCQTGREKESIAYFEKAYRNPVYKTPGVAYMNEGNCYAKLNELDLAEGALQRSLRLMPNSPQALFYLANVNYKRSNLDAARKQMADAMRSIDPGADMLWLALRIERKLGDQNSEQSFQAQLRRKFPDSAEYQELLKGNYE